MVKAMELDVVDIYFVPRFMLIVMGTFLVSSSGTFVRKEYLNVLQYIGKIRKLNWASFVMQFLHDSVIGLRSHVKKVAQNEDNKGHRYLPGCTFFLQFIIS